MFTRCWSAPEQAECDVYGLSGTSVLYKVHTWHYDELPRRQQPRGLSLLTSKPPGSVFPLTSGCLL